MKITDTEKAINEIRSALERGESIEMRPLSDEPQAFEIELQQVGKTLLANWKTIILITLLFALIGVIGGVIYYYFTTRETPQSHLDLYVGIKVDSEDDYNDIFNDAAQYYKEMNIYLNVINKDIESNKYKGKKADERHLNQIKEDISESYENTFLLGKNLYDLYSPIRDKDIEKKQIKMELKQQAILKEMMQLQHEISYLSNIAAAGATIEGPVTDKAIAGGVNKARALATYQQEYERNAKLLNELSNVDNSEWLQQREKIERLIQEGISDNARLSNELNQFAKEYYAKQNLSINVSRVPNADNPTSLDYTVVIEKAEQELSSFRIPKAITLLFCCFGFGLSCLWVLWKYYKPTPQHL